MEDCLMNTILFTVTLTVLSGPVTLISGLIIGGINKWPKNTYWLSLVIFGASIICATIFSVMCLLMLRCDNIDKAQQPQQQPQPQEQEDPSAIVVGEEVQEELPAEP